MEFIDKPMEHSGKKFASNAKGNAALTLGIIGAASWLFNGGLTNGLLGGNSNCANAVSNACDGPSAWEVYQKECHDNVALTAGIYQTRITDLQEKFDLYTRLSDRINTLEKSEVATATALPLVFQLANCNSERYTDNKVSCEARERRDADVYLQSQLCKKVDGQLGLPFSSLITGIPTLPNVQYVVTGCNGATPAV